MATTTSGFRYPVSADDPDIPRDIRQLAEDIDNYLNATGAGAFSGVLPVFDINGNATTATRLATTRTISLGGSLSGSASFDGSANITISATVDPVAGTMPTGAMTQYLGTTAPTGWLFCNGANVSRSTYSGLFTVLGTRYGAGDGSTTFALPDLRERFARGSASTSSLSGTAGGSATHQHTNTGLSTGSAGGHNHEVDVPSLDITSGAHSHTAPSHTHTGPLHSHSGPSHQHTGPSHAHAVNIGVNETTSAGSHSHTATNAANNINAGVYATVADNTSAGSHTHDYNPPSTDSTDAGTGNTSLSGTGATGDAGTGATGGPTYTAPDTSATTSDSHSHTINHAAFNTTGGEGAHTHGQGTSDSISNIPPYIDVNYIVKI